MKKVMASALAATLLLTGCGSSGKTTYDPKNYVDYIVSGREVTTFDYLESYSSVDLKYTPNMVNGLVETDQYGNLVPCLAESWEHNDDYTVWTFKLREGVQWMTSGLDAYGEVTADDFVYAAEYILNPVNASYNVASYDGFIAGARAYYDALSNGEDADFSTVGVKALDRYTVQYTMEEGKRMPYFLSVVTYNAFYPANRAFVESLGTQDDGSSRFGMDKDSILYNGPYITQSVELNAQKVFVKNPQYWDLENATFDTVTVLMYRDQESVYEAFKRGEASYAPLLSTQAQALYDANDETLIQTELLPVTYCLFLNNQTTYSEDTNAALSNLSFRQSLFYGLDRQLYNEVINPINPKSIEGYSYSGRTFVTAPDGTDYTQMSHLQKWQTSQFDMSKAEAYKQQAISELSAQGVSFPIKLKFYSTAGNETEAVKARMLKEMIEGLGTDYVEVELHECQTWSTEVRATGDYALQVSGWTPDWADPVNCMTSIKTNGTMNNANDVLNMGVSHWDYTEFDEMVEAADLIVDLEERYQAFGAIENYLLENAYYIPLYQGGGTYEVTTVNNYTKKHTGVGLDQFSWKGIVAYDHAITQEENEAFKAEWETNRQALLSES